MRPPFYSPIGRIGIRPDEPRAIVGPRQRGSRRPHTDAAVAAVRDLVEGSSGQRRVRGSSDYHAWMLEKE